MPIKLEIFERLCCISWIIASFILSASFCGVMYSKLTLKDQPFRYETLEDFLINPNTPLYLFKDTGPYIDLKGSSDPVKKKLWKMTVDQETSRPLSEINFYDEAVRLQDGDAAYVMYKRILEILATFACGTLTEIHISKKPLMDSILTLYMRKDIAVEVKEIIKKVAFQIMETKIGAAIFDQMAELGRICLSAGALVDELETPLTTKKFYFIAIFYVIAFTFALAGLISEFIIWYN